MAMAGVIGALNVRSNFPRQPHVLSQMAEVEGEVVIRADRARSMAVHPAGAHSQSDAA